LVIGLQYRVGSIDLVAPATLALTG